MNKTTRIQASALKIKSGVKAGDQASVNHNETQLKIKASVKAGGLTVNHNETPLGRLKIKSGVKAGGVIIQG